MKKNNENSDVYIKLDYSNAHDAKKNLFEITESIIHTQMIFEKLKKLHKEEISERNNSKKQINMMISEINHIIQAMPQVKIEKPKMKKEESKKVEAAENNENAKKDKTVKKKIEKKTLNQELEDIRKKIEGLKK